LRVPFSQDTAVTIGTFSSAANCDWVNPRRVRMARICLGAIGFTGGGSLTVRSRAGSAPAANASTRATSAPASKSIPVLFVFIVCAAYTMYKLVSMG